MKKRFLLLTLIMCLLGGVNLKTLNAQETFTIIYNQGASNQYTLTFTIIGGDNTCSVGIPNYEDAPGAATEIEIPEIVENGGTTYTVVDIPLSAFDGASSQLYDKAANFTKLTIPNTVTSIGKWAFYNWKGLKEVIFGSGLTTIANQAFEGASAIGTIYCYAEEPPTCGGNAVFHTNVKTGAKLYVPAESLNNYKSQNYGYGWGYISPSNTYKLDPTTPPTVTLNTPTKGAEGIFNPSLSFTLGDAKQYQIQMAEGTGAFGIVQDWTDGNGNISYQTNLLKSNTTYSWKVVAENDYGETTSEVYTFTTRNITAAPGAISNVSPEDGAELDNNPTLSWTFGANTESYKVCLSVEDGDWETVRDWTNTNNALTASFNTASLNDGDGLDANQTYNWQILTKNSFGENGGDVYSFTKVGAPGNVTPILPADGAIDVTNTVLSWRFDGNATHYRVLMDLGSGFEYVLGNNGTWIETTGVTASFDASNEGLVSSKEYRWCIDVKNDLGQRTVHQGGDPISIFSFTTASVLNTTYKSPENGATNIANAKLTWNYNGTPDYYQVLMGTAENELVAKTEWKAAEGTGGTFQTENLNDTTRYYWQVKIKNGETVMEGEIWSFVTTLPAPTNVTATPENVYPGNTDPYNAVATVTWDAIANTTYNVYVNGEKYNTEALTINTCDVILPYNMDPGDSIQVSAIYPELGESEKSEAAIVKVTGYANVNGYVKDESGNAIEGVTVTYSGTDDFEQPDTIVFTTGADGKYSGKVLVGRYSITAVKEDYSEHSAVAKDFENGETKEETITLVNKLAFYIGIETNTAMELRFHLTNAEWYGGLFAAPEGNFTIYLRKENEVVKEYGPVEFIYMNNVNALYMKLEQHIQGFNSIWANLPNGTYNVGVAISGKNYINWSENIERNYHIFMASTNNDWNEDSNWFGGLPGTTDNVTLRDSVVVAEESDITVANVMIEGSAALTINGTLNANDVTITTDASLVINGILKANDVINKGVFGKLLINDGGQLYRTATTFLRGKFVKNIKTPTNWETTKDGWQLMASPFTNEDGAYTYFTQFTNVATGDYDYDLYNYNGSALKEWINIKDTKTNGDTFGTTFVNGTGYLVAHESAREVALTGVFKSGTSYTIENLVYDAEKDLANFHLLGNPFPFNMDWSNVKGNRLVEGFAVLNENGDNYEYKTSGTIKVGEGFFIRTRDIDGTELGEPSFTHSITTGAPINRGAEKETVNSLNVIATGNVGKDNVVINFAGESEGFPKLQNFNDAIATVYVQDKGAKYGIYNCDENTTEVELCFNANQMGNYTISVEDSEEFETVILVDRFTGIETNMLLEDYTFTAMSEENNNRFFIRLGYGQQTTDNSHFAYVSGEDLIIEAEGTVQIIDMMGRVVYNNDVTSDNNRINVSDFNNGAYVVRVINESEIKVEKVVIY